jgi:hypothetical protein
VQYFSWRNFYCAPQPVSDTGVLSQRKWNKMLAVKLISPQQLSKLGGDKLCGTPSGSTQSPRAFSHQFLN